MPNMEFYEKRLPDGDLMETLAIWRNEGKWSGVSVLTIKLYSSGFCEVSFCGRRKHFKRNLATISRQKFQIRFIQAMQYLQAVVSFELLEKITEELKENEN